MNATEFSEDVEEGKEKAAVLMKLYKRGKLTGPEWAKHLNE